MFGIPELVAEHASASAVLIVVLIVMIVYLFVYYHGVWFMGPWSTPGTKTFELLEKIEKFTKGGSK